MAFSGMKIRLFVGRQGDSWIFLKIKYYWIGGWEQRGV